MKRLILFAITCIVVDQLKSQTGWLTKCKGLYDDGQVVFSDKIVRGQMVTYKPYIADGDEFIHGEILNIEDAPPQKRKPVVSSDTGKSPE